MGCFKHCFGILVVKVHFILYLWKFEMLSLTDIFVHSCFIIKGLYMSIMV